MPDGDGALPSPFIHSSLILANLQQAKRCGINSMAYDFPLISGSIARPQQIVQSTLTMALSLFCKGSVPSSFSDQFPSSVPEEPSD
uniref:Uncharacterized protein n=1 Tax=Globodera rostochiensis TaxID=31243 RepID=A0A914HH37_GLORO